MIQILIWRRLFSVLNGKSNCEFLTSSLFSWLSLSCSSPSVYIPEELSLAVWAMRVSITAWYTCCDSLVTAGILSLIVEAITVTFCNSLRWSRNRYNMWNMKWSGDVMDSINVGGNQWSWLQWSSYSGRKNWSRSTMFSEERVFSGQSIPQEVERSQE